MLWWQERSSSCRAPSIAAPWGAALLGQAVEVCGVDVKSLLCLSMRIWMILDDTIKKKKKKSSLSLPSTQNRNPHEQATMRLKFRWFRNSDDSEKCQNKDGVMMQSLVGYYSFQRTWIFLIHRMDRGPLSNFICSTQHVVPYIFILCYPGLFGKPSFSSWVRVLYICFSLVHTFSCHLNPSWMILLGYKQDFKRVFEG